MKRLLCVGALVAMVSCGRPSVGPSSSRLNDAVQEETKTVRVDFAPELAASFRKVGFNPSLNCMSVAVRRSINADGLATTEVVSPLNVQIPYGTIDCARTTMDPTDYPAVKVGTDLSSSWQDGGLYGVKLTSESFIGHRVYIGSLLYDANNFADNATIADLCSGVYGKTCNASVNKAGYLFAIRVSRDAGQ